MKVRRAIISVLLILSILASTVVMLRLDSDKEEAQVQEAQAATFDDSGRIEYQPAADTAMIYGTAQNPFTVLEIVPYAGYAEIGYLIGGKEPVDMARLSAIAMGNITSGGISAGAARAFIEYLAEKGYMTLLTENEAVLCNAKDAELPAEQRKFACYQYTEKLTGDTKCYVTNANSFLRESIGLKYVTEGNTVNYNNFDIDRYEFMGWFEAGTDVAFDFEERLFRDVTVYAKWRPVKSDGTVIEPVIVTPTPEAVVPAEGYDSGITVHFEEYIPASLQGQGSLAGLPSDITNVKTDGTKGGSVLTEPAEPVLTGSPEAGNYILRGWYLDPAGTMPYRFGDAIPENYIRNGVMTLYPLWVQKQNCVITFDAALPQEYMIEGNTVQWPAVLSDTGNGSAEETRYLHVPNGSRMAAEDVPQLYLLGNVDYKVKHYVIDVVTVTPQDLNKGGNIGGYSINADAVLENLALIEKANVIMLSPQSHFYESDLPAGNVIEITDNNKNKRYYRFGNDERTAVDIWKACVNPALFEFTEVPQEGDTGTYGFLKNDLCWEVILAIFNETVLTEPKAALIYDAESYHMALMNGSGATSESPKKLLFGEKTSIDVNTLTGRNYSNLASSNNVYKLYLMMNQMNPQLFYATFLKEHIYAKMNGSVSTGCYNWAENTGELSNEVIYWNTATFLLCLLLDEADGNIWIENGTIRLKGNPWEKWGVTLDVHTLSDNLDDATGEPNQESGLVKGNCFTYESDVVNITDYFATNASIPYQRHVNDVYEYYGRDENNVTMSEIVHYLIQIAKGETEDTLPGAGYDKDIRILEVQPSESYLEPITWLWNINTYIDGFQGTTEITQQSSLEFIGRIEDLNSTYDLLYIGSDVSKYAVSRTVISEELLEQYADDQVRWYEAGSTVVLAESSVVSHRKVVEYELQAGETITLDIPQIVKVAKRKQVPAGTQLIELDQSQNLQVNQLIEPEGERKYSNDVYHNLTYGGSANVKVKAGDTIVTTQPQDMDVLAEEPRGAGSFTSPVTQTVQRYHTVEELLPAGSEVTLAVGTGLRALNVPPEIKIQPYSYFHTGAKVDLNQNNNIELTGILGGNADRVNEYYYSGNDITKARMQEILEFAAAGYPVVIASRLMKRNAEGVLEADTTVVDRASNMYLLLSELAAGESDPNSPYYGNLFYEGTETTDENYARYKRQLLEALTETKCELNINRMPVLYANDKPVAESYLNGASGKENEKTAEISFTITDVEDASYQLKFYIDQNADGRYEESERLVGKLKIYEVVLGRTQEVTQLKANRNYIMEANLEDYVGVIPWKLEIVRSDNPVIRDSVTECCAILPTEAQKPTLHVLQVIPALEYNGNGDVVRCSSIYLPTTEDMERLEWALGCWEDIGQGKDSVWTAEQWAKWNAFWAGKDISGHTVDSLTENLEWEYGEWVRGGRLNDYVVDRMYASPGLSHLFMGALLESIPYDEGSGGRRRSAVGFWLYMRSVQDFDITVDRLTIGEFVQTTATNKVLDGDVSAWALEDYDMMILGFSDAYPDISDEDALKVIEDFCAAGKQILFTHDTTSFRNYTQDSAQYSTGIYWGYNITRTFRDMLGMDRFGATLMYPLDINGNLLNDGLSISEAITKKKDAPYKSGMTQDVSSQEKLLQNVLNTTVNGTVKYYVHGYSDSLLYRFSAGRYSEPLRTQSASKVNVGQLTEYPYRIGNEIGTAVTHEPYYQLDMEEDIVVWYALEGTPGDMTASADYAGVHHDVRNNYYLYSRGNIIYTGLGHDSYLTKDELKLFVNTFVASYRIEADPPSIEVQNSNATTADSEYFYVDFDSWDELKAIGTEVIADGYGNQFQRVRYVIKETTALRNLKMTMEYYLTASAVDGVELTELTDTVGEVKQSGYYVTRDAVGAPLEIVISGDKPVTYRSSDGAMVTELATGVEYYVDIPISLLNGKDGAELLFRAKLNYGRQNDQYVYSYQKVRFLRRGLYDLD